MNFKYFSVAWRGVILFSFPSFHVYGIMIYGLD